MGPVSGHQRVRLPGKRCKLVCLCARHSPAGTRVQQTRSSDCQAARNARRPRQGPSSLPQHVACLLASETRAGSARNSGTGGAEGLSLSHQGLGQARGCGLAALWLFVALGWHQADAKQPLGLQLPKLQARGGLQGGLEQASGPGCPRRLVQLCCAVLGPRGFWKPMQIWKGCTPSPRGLGSKAQAQVWPPPPQPHLSGRPDGARPRLRQLHQPCQLGAVGRGHNHVEHHTARAGGAGGHGVSWGATAAALRAAAAAAGAGALADVARHVHHCTRQEGLDSGGECGDVAAANGGGGVALGPGQGEHCRGLAVGWQGSRGVGGAVEQRLRGVGLVVGWGVVWCGVVGGVGGLGQPHVR